MVIDSDAPGIPRAPHALPPMDAAASGREPSMSAGDAPLIRSPLTLENLPDDVFCLIAAEALRYKGSLRRLSLTSRRVRASCMPHLFARCFAHPNGRRGIPPEGIRPYVVHITYVGSTPRTASHMAADRDAHTPPPDKRERDKYCDVVAGDACGAELAYLPALRSVTFRCTLTLSHLELMKKCLARSGLKSIMFTPAVRWCGEHPDPRVDSPYPPNIAVTHLVHSSSAWRELTCSSERRNIAAEIALESHCVALLALAISKTAEVIDVPLESAPVARMSELSWPHLQQLALSGRYIFPSQSTSMPRLLAHTPNLQKLSLLASQSFALRLPRSPVLGRNTSFSVNLPHLRTLILSYPDPDDAIFAVSAPHLMHLSLRDWPRFYWHQDIFTESNRWAAPVLTASECLKILQRTKNAHYYLETLELVYQDDGADEALLRYVAASFPRLTRLELHRYRQPGEEVPHLRIASLLEPLRALRILHLNLDFPDAPGPRAAFARQAPGAPSRHARWVGVARALGVELADALEPHCAALEAVALLMHDAGAGSFWWRFRPARAGAVRVEEDRAAAETDCEPMPMEWGKRAD